MKPILIVAALFAAQPVFAQVNFVSEPGRVSPPQVGASYADAAALALRTGKPLLVWVGGNHCPECVADDPGEFVHCFVDRFGDVPAPAIVVGLPEKGSLYQVATIRQWDDLGHLGTSRAAIIRYQRRGIVTDETVQPSRYDPTTGNPFRANLSPYGSGRMTQPMTYQQPAMQRSVIRFRSRSSGGCAT